MPVIVIFTKYEEFRITVGQDLEDEEVEKADDIIDDECEKRFNEEFCKDWIKSFVKLESKYHICNQ